MGGIQCLVIYQATVKQAGRKLAPDEVGKQTSSIKEFGPAIRFNWNSF